MSRKKFSTIVIADCDGSVFLLLRPKLKEYCLLLHVKSVDRALESIKKYKPNIVITSISFKNSNGFELIKKAYELDRLYPKFIIVSHFVKPSMLHDHELLSSLGVDHFLIKSRSSVNKVSSLVINEFKKINANNNN